MSHMESSQYETRGSSYGRYEGTQQYQQQETPGQSAPPYNMDDDAFLDAFAQRISQRMYQGQQGKLYMSSPPKQRLSPGQRLALAIVSVAMLVPLGGISIALVAVSQLWIVGLVALIIFGVIIALVNIIFNMSS